MALSLYRADWQRRKQPVLSAMTTKQIWCKVTLYSPRVLRIENIYKVWYLGNSSKTRNGGMDLGYAESPDGINWTPLLENPILSSGDLPLGESWQTPHILFDADEDRYKMWFVMVDGHRNKRGWLDNMRQRLGYASSSDGIHWDVYPEPIYPSGRGPCVLKDGPGIYRMWMNSAPDLDGEFSDLVGNVYRFESPDGIVWTRDPKPVLTANDTLRSVVYPFVLRHNRGYTMWYGCHVENGIFEIYASTSADGITWTHHHNQPAFPATRNPSDFDGRYTSTPCVFDDDDCYLLYYSTRDWGNLYGAGDGTVRFDNAGIYRHIGVAVCPKV